MSSIFIPWGVILAEKRLPFSDIGNLAKLLRQARKKAKKSQVQAALDLGVGQSAVSKWEKGETEPPLEYLKYALMEYKISLDSFLTGKGSGQEETDLPQRNRETTRLLKQAEEVIESEGPYSDALAQTIKAFHLSVTSVTGQKTASIECGECHRIIKGPLSEFTKDDPWRSCPFCGAALEPDLQEVPSAERAVGEFLEEAQDSAHRSRKTST